MEEDHITSRVVEGWEFGSQFIKNRSAGLLGWVVVVELGELWGWKNRVRTDEERGR